MFQGDGPDQTKAWFQTLQFYTQSLGGWRKRRKGLANIMVDDMPVAAGGDEAAGGEEPQPE